MTKGSKIQTGLPQPTGGKGGGAPPLTIAERIRANKEKRERVATGINGGRLVVNAPAAGKPTPPPPMPPPTWGGAETAPVSTAKTPPATWPQPKKGK